MHTYLFSNPLSFAQLCGFNLCLLLVVMAQQLLPKIWVWFLTRLPLSR